VKLIRGVYGSGKDYLMLNQALRYIEDGLFEKIIFLRPNVTVANVPDIGYLKGSADEKLEWTLAPFYDKVGGREGVEYLVEGG
jgi:predicted ribonuclease YlaK